MLMVVLICAGNMLVLWGRHTSRDENKAVSIVIKNLAGIKNKVVLMLAVSH